MFSHDFLLENDRFYLEKMAFHNKNNTERIISTSILKIWRQFFPIFFLKIAEFKKRQQLQIIFRADFIRIV